MECWCVSKHKSWLYWLLITLMISILMVQRVQGGCIENERKALLEIKASLIESYIFKMDPPLPTWVDHGSTSGGSNGECCDWERVKCNTTTGHVTDLSLSSVMMVCEDRDQRTNWPLNVSLFLHFKELRSLNLSFNCLDNKIVTTGLERLSNLKKLEMLDLSSNSIGNDIFSSLGALTSLRILHLGGNNLEGYFPALGLENLETLDLTNPGYGVVMRGFERVSILRKLKILNLGHNKFNESLITSLSDLPLLKALDLSANELYGAFPAQELAHLTNLEKLDLSGNSLDVTPSIQDCERLSKLKKLENIGLGANRFNKSIISCLSVLPSLKTLDLSYSYYFGSFFPIQELSDLRELETLDLSYCGLDSVTLNDLSHLPDLKVLILRYNFFSGTALLMEALAYFHNLEVLDLSDNLLVGRMSSAIHTLSSLRAVSFANNKLNGPLSDCGLCELKNLYELDLSGNMFDGNLPQCFNNLSSLKVFDISSNQFTGMLMPSLIANLTSLEYVDFSNNQFEGSFSFSSFSNHTKLEAVRFICDKDKFEVETEEPIGWIPMFQLKFLVLSGCNMNSHKGSVVPGFLVHQRKLRVLELPHNSLVGHFPNWLIENNTMLKALNLRNNLFSGIISMPLYRNANTRWLDMSGNLMNGTIPADIQMFLPYVTLLNLSGNSLDGAIPSSIADMSELWVLDLSDNEFSGEVPKGLFTNLFELRILKLSKNRLHGKVLSGNLSLGNIKWLYLDTNSFTGKIGNGDIKNHALELLDISDNFFTGMIPHWIGNMNTSFELVMRNNSLEGQFPCGTTLFSFLDISENSFSGPIPSCLNWQYMKVLHLGSNRFTGSIPNAFWNLTDVVTLDIGNNILSGRIPEFLGELSKLTILVLRKNNFSGYIPKQLCQLRYVSLMDLSSNSLSGSIPRCLKNINSPTYHAFIRSMTFFEISFYNYLSVLHEVSSTNYDLKMFEIQDEVQFTTKEHYYSYRGYILDYMTGLDLSCNKLTGEIPTELGLTQVHALNLSHNLLVGPIPMNFSYLSHIESLDLSSNALSGEVPSQLINLLFLSVFNVSHNNLSGRLPEMGHQFGTFSKESYEGNPLLCGPPLEKKCMTTSQVTSQVTAPSVKEGNYKWYDIDMICFYGSFGSTWVVFLLGFAVILYTNPHWHRRWLDFIEESMFTCYYFLDDSVSKLSMFFRK